MNLTRWLKHAWVTPGRLNKTFPAAALERIQAAIAAAETGHSGEIRFAVESALPWSYLRRDAPARQRAVMVFAKLRVWDTEHNNGVLIYVELADRSVEIVADRGIARHVPQAEWEAICAAMRARFRAGEYEAGVIEGVRRIGALLETFFPLTGGQSNPNELTNRPTVL